MRRCIALLLLVVATAAHAKKHPWGPIQVITGPDPMTGSAQVLFVPKIQFPAQGGIAVKAAFLPIGTAYMVGGQGELMLDDSFGIGVASYSLDSEITPQVGGIKNDIGLTYGGIRVDDSFLPKRLFYLNTSLTLGVGQAWRLPRQDNAQRRYATFGVIEPEMSIFLNATSEARLGLSFGWRWYYGADVADAMGVDLGGPSLMLSVLYGKL